MKKTMSEESWTIVGVEMERWERAGSGDLGLGRAAGVSQFVQMPDTSLQSEVVR